MYCPNCGARIQDGQRFCANCGTGFTEAGITVDAQTEEVTEYASFWRRLIAYILDNFMIGAVFFLISMFLPKDTILFSIDVFGRWPIEFTAFGIIENMIMKITVNCM